MEKEKDMMNPLNWGVNEIKDACIAFLFSLCWVFIMYATLLIFRQDGDSNNICQVSLPKKRNEGTIKECSDIYF